MTWPFKNVCSNMCGGEKLIQSVSHIHSAHCELTGAIPLLKDGLIACPGTRDHFKIKGILFYLHVLLLYQLVLKRRDCGLRGKQLWTLVKATGWTCAWWGLAYKVMKGRALSAGGRKFWLGLNNQTNRTLIAEGWCCSRASWSCWECREAARLNKLVQEIRSMAAPSQIQFSTKSNRPTK